MVARCLGPPGELGDGGEVTDEHATRSQGIGDDVQTLPRGQHVHNYSIDGPHPDRGRQALDQVADGDLPGRVRTAEEAFHVAPRDVGELLTTLEGVEVAK